MNRVDIVNSAESSPSSPTRTHSEIAVDSGTNVNTVKPGLSDISNRQNKGLHEKWYLN